MSAPVAFRVCDKFNPTLYSTIFFPIGFFLVGIVIRINEIVSGVIGRVDIDTFDLFEIAGLQEFQDFEIIGLYHQIFCGVKIDTARFVRDQSRTAGGEGPAF